MRHFLLFYSLLSNLSAPHCARAGKCSCLEETRVLFFLQDATTSADVIVLNHEITVEIEGRSCRVMCAFTAQRCVLVRVRAVEREE